GPHLTDGYTFDAFVTCTAFRKVAVLDKTAWNNAKMQPGIDKATLFLVCGNTTHVTSNSHSLLTVLVSNTPPTMSLTT
ncbi:hypothetical protein ACHAW6_001866, partial [Cyclotella cf. meneghiniana]